MKINLSSFSSIFLVWSVWRTKALGDYMSDTFYGKEQRNLRLNNSPESQHSILLFPFFFFFLFLSVLFFSVCVHTSRNFYISSCVPNKLHEVSLKNISIPFLWTGRMNPQKSELLVYSDIAQDSPLWPLRLYVTWLDLLFQPHLRPSTLHSLRSSHMDLPSVPQTC